MKSFNEFLNISEKKAINLSGTKGEENAKKFLRNIEKKISNTKKSTPTNTNTNTNTSTKGIDPKEVNRRLSASTTRNDQVTRQYGTAGGTGDSNMGAGAGGASGNRTIPKPETSPKKPIKRPNNFDINTKHADSKVTFGQGQSIIPKDAKTVTPTPKPTNPNTLNTIKPISKGGLFKKAAKAVKGSYNSKKISTPSRTIHKGGALLSGIGATMDDKAKGRSTSRSIGKGITSFGAYMSAKPLARIPKVGPIISAVVGDIAQRKSGKVYDSVMNKVTGQKPKPKKVKSPLRGQL